MTYRQRTHQQAVNYAARKLRQQGLHVARRGPHDGISLCADGVQIAVRSASPRQRRHHVRAKSGKAYHYWYTTLHWNLHAHSERRVQPDVWVLYRSDRARLTLVVPAELIGPTRKTVALASGPVQKRRHHSPLWSCAARWDMVAARKVANAAA